MRSPLRVCATLAIAAAASSCVTSDVLLRDRDPDTEMGRLDVVFVIGKSQVPASGPVVSALCAVEGTELHVVFRSEEATWTARDLPPGRYVVDVRSWVDDEGEMSTSRVTHPIEIRAGEHVAARIRLWDGDSARESTRDSLRAMLLWFLCCWHGVAPL